MPRSTRAREVRSESQTDDAELLDLLSPARMNACQEARDWIATQPDPATAWRECRRGDWLMWLLTRSNPDHPGEQYLLGADFAEDALQWIPAEYEDTRATCEGVIEVVRRYAVGDATEEERAAACAAAGAAGAARTPPWRRAASAAAWCRRGRQCRRLCRR